MRSCTWKLVEAGLWDCWYNAVKRLGVGMRDGRKTRVAGTDQVFFKEKRSGSGAVDF